MKTSSSLGFGERTVQVPVRGSIVLDLPAEGIDGLVGHEAEDTVLNMR
jgi:hypothetical protein